MNKTMKGALAASAAAALLAGGAGTLAFWTDSQTVNAGAITTGHLALNTVAADEGSWKDVTAGGNQTIADISTFHMVPGDALTYTRTFTISASGQNLTGTITPTALVAPASDIAPYWTQSVAVTGTASGNSTISSADDGRTVTVTVNVGFSATAPGKVVNGGVNAGDDDTVDLSALQLNLVQSQGTAHGNSNPSS